MNNQGLTVENGSSDAQSTTQNPQVATPVSGLAGDGNSLQSGTASSSLTAAQGSVPLKASSLPSVKLQASTATSGAPLPAVRHTNAPLAIISIVFFIVAVILFYSTTSGAKNTTDTQ